MIVWIAHDSYDSLDSSASFVLSLEQEAPKAWVWSLGQWIPLQVLDVTWSKFIKTNLYIFRLMGRKGYLYRSRRK